MVKNLPADPGDVGDGFDPWMRKSPVGGNGNPLQYSCLGKSHGQRSLAGYSLLGHKESDTTERLTQKTDTHTQILPNMEQPFLSFYPFKQ